MNRRASYWIAASLAIFAFGVFALLQNYFAGGIYWDFIAYTLFAKSLVSPAFYVALHSGSLMQSINYQNSFYYEYFRAPLMPLLLVPLLLVLGSHFALAYILIEMLLLLCSAFYLSRGLKIDFGILLILFLTPYSLAFLTLLNGSEILTTALLMFTFAMLARGKWQAGILMALAGLAKYPSLIFLPLLFSLEGGQRNKAIVAFIITTAPWLLFNLYAFSNPFYGYTSSFAVFGTGNAVLFPANVVSQSLIIVLMGLLPAFLVMAALIVYLYLKGNTSNKLWRQKMAQAGNWRKIVAPLLVLGAAGFLIVSLHSNLDNLPRHGYLLYLGVAIAIAFGISRLLELVGRRSKKLVTTIAYSVVSLASLFMLLYLYSSVHSNYIFNGYGSTNQTVSNSVAALEQMGLANCSIVSNAWVYLRFQGVDAHWPYYYNATVQRYPILIFGNIGVPASALNTKNITKSYNYSHFSVELPKNYTCVT
ncbi:MAG: hypothetical protein KGH61_00155 [Candidatus Micrarchaeota archaeon]|nr:hypothetical protein [Candidatus Micrarchaeota archaeon]MDE1847349.1 hypothetical protein [Candidatus Micrarchaeota archaeon]MDE1863964.1 hypothetical protein [Candidatus Micrarchaeota archaeon]